MNFYQALKVERNASGRAIKAAYQRRVAEAQPNTAKMRTIVEAYRVLRDRQRRDAYDAELHRLVIQALPESDFFSALRRELGTIARELDAGLAGAQRVRGAVSSIADALRRLIRRSSGKV